MRRPQPTLMDTPRQQAAAIFVFEHFRVTNLFGRDGLQYISVQREFRNWMAEVRKDEPQRTERMFRAAGRCVCGAPLSKQVKNPTMCDRCRHQLLGHELAA